MSALRRLIMKTTKEQWAEARKKLHEEFGWEWTPANLAFVDDLLADLAERCQASGCEHNLAAERRTYEENLSLRARLLSAQVFGEFVRDYAIANPSERKNLRKEADAFLALLDKKTP